MKKILCSLLLASFLNAALPVQKAEAGFCILGATQEFVWDSKYEWIDNVLVFALPISLITTSIFAIGITGDPFNNFTIIAGMVTLDANPNIEGQKLAIIGSLQKRYPYLDNQQVLNQLAEKVIKRYPEMKDEKGNAMISFSKNEIAEVTKAIDLSVEQEKDLQSLN